MDHFAGLDVSVKFGTGLWPTCSASNFATLRPRRRHRGRYFLGAIKPEVKLDPGFLEHLRLSSRAVIGPGARFLEFLFTGPVAYKN